LLIPQIEDPSRSLRQSAQAVPQLVQQTAVVEPGEGFAERISNFRGRVDELHVTLCAAEIAPVMLFDRVPGDTSQKRAEHLYIGKPIDCLEGPQEDLLRKIVDRPQIRANCRHIGPQLSLVPPDQFGQGLRLAATARLKGNVGRNGWYPVCGGVSLSGWEHMPHLIMIRGWEV